MYLMYKLYRIQTKSNQLNKKSSSKPSFRFKSDNEPANYKAIFNSVGQKFYFLEYFWVLRLNFLVIQLIKTNGSVLWQSPNFLCAAYKASLK